MKQKLTTAFKKIKEKIWKPERFNYIFHFKKPLTKAQKIGWLKSYHYFFDTDHDRVWIHLDGFQVMVLCEKKLDKKRLVEFYNLWSVIGLQQVEEKQYK